MAPPTNYAGIISPSNTPQTEQVDPKQVANSAGGFSFAVDKWKRLERFLILGSEGGSYYASERKLTIENAKAVSECLDEDPARAIAVVRDISVAGRAPKNDPAIFALALASAHTNPVARALALEALPAVARIGTHLFQFVEQVDQLRGWGRGLRRALGAWYEGKDASHLAYQVLKYQQRGKWSHRDVLRLAHLTPKDTPQYDGADDAEGKLVLAPTGKVQSNQAVYRWAIGAELGTRSVTRKNRDGVVVEYPAVGELPPLLQAYEALKAEKELPKVLAAIRAHKLTHEMVPGEWKAKPEVWEALSEHMPMHALVRNLANLTAKGVIAPLSDNTKRITEQLTNQEAIRKSRLHPIALLSALRVYERGHGEKGSLTWTPDQSVVHALGKAFDLAFDNVVPTGKKFLLALDVSGSMMAGNIAGVPGLTPREASAAMALVTMRTETHHIVGFTGGGWGSVRGDACTALPLHPGMTLSEVTNAISGLPFGSTDCAQPMLYAIKNKLPVDCFVIYTDSETYAGTPHPHTALKQFRQHVEPSAKLVTVAMVSNVFTIADPNDPGQMDVVGFDTSTPAVLADFARG